MKNAFFFLAGTIFGFSLGWMLARSINEKEIESVKESFSNLEKRRAEREKEAMEAAEAARNKPDLREYHDLIKKYGDLQEPEDEQKNLSQALEEAKSKFRPPYQISEEDFGTELGYSTISCTYYADGILTDETDRPMEDADEYIGVENLVPLENREEMVIYVRNERLKIDYEISFDYRDYSDVLKSNPHLMEDYE